MTNDTKKISPAWILLGILVIIGFLFFFLRRRKAKAPKPPPIPNGGGNGAGGAGGSTPAPSPAAPVSNGNILQSPQPYNIAALPSAAQGGVVQLGAGSTTGHDVPTGFANTNNRPDTGVGFVPSITAAGGNAPSTVVGTQAQQATQRLIEQGF